MPASIARLSGGTSLKPIQNRRQLQYPRPGLQKFPVKNPVTGCLTHDCPLLTHDLLVSTKFYPVAPRFRLSPFAINFRSSLTLPTHPVRGDKTIAGEVVAAQTCGCHRKAIACPTASLHYFNARKLAVIRHEPNSQVPNSQVPNSQVPNYQGAQLPSALCPEANVRVANSCPHCR